MVKLNDLKKFAQEKKLISDGLKLLNNPLANTASSVAAHLGYGKRRRKHRRKRRQDGAGLFTDLGTGLGNLSLGLGSGLHSLLGGSKRKGRKSVIKM